jgi:hypothetical protein
MAFPPRYVPTLTEVVIPEQRFSAPLAQPVPQAAPVALRPDTGALVQTVMNQLTPQLHAQLRNSANDLLEMHLREVLPALQMELEAEIRRSIEAALARPPGSSGT